MFFLGILLDYILPAIYTSFISLVLVLLFLFIFRIKDSNIRILFFFIPLIKPFIVVAEKINFDKYYSISKPFIGAFRFPDYRNILDSFKIFDKGPLLVSEINYLILFLISITILLILITRWINLLLFYRKLSCEDRVGRKEVPELYNIIDNFIGKINLKEPSLSLTHRDYYSPFVAGIKNYTIVLSPNLIEKLNRSEREILIQHELSHIKRKDNFIGWIALILRDFLFLNPFAYIAYHLIRTEQEKDSDKLVVKYSDNSKKEISKCILNIILKMKSISASKHISENTHSFTFSPFNLFNQIKIKNRVNSISRTNPARIYSRIFPRILMYAGFVFLLLFQIIFIIRLDNYIIFLR